MAVASPGAVQAKKDELGGLKRRVASYTSFCRGIILLNIGDKAPLAPSFGLPGSVASHRCAPARCRNTTFLVAAKLPDGGRCGLVSVVTLKLWFVVAVVSTIPSGFQGKPADVGCWRQFEVRFGRDSHLTGFHPRRP